MSYSIDSRRPSRQLHLYSPKGRINPSVYIDDSELYYKFSESIVDVLGEQTDVLVSVTSATLPFSWPNVAMSLFNSSLIIASAYGTDNIVVPDGYYSILDLITYLNGTSAFSSFGMAMTYNRPTGLVSLNATTPFTVAGGLANTLGFSYFDSLTANISTSKKAGTPVSLFRTQSVYIESDLTTESFDSRRGGRSPVLARVPVRGTPGTFIQWENTTHFKTRLHAKQIGPQFYIRLTDDNGNNIDTNGVPYSITIQFDFLNELPETSTEREELGQEVADDFGFGIRNTLY